MYARITHIAAYPWRIDEMLDRLDEVRGQIAQIPGLRYWFTTSDRESGEVVGIAIYDSKGDADAAASTDQEWVASFGAFFLTPAEVNEYAVDGSVINA